MAIDLPERKYRIVFHRDPKFEVCAVGEEVLLWLLNDGAESGTASIHLHHFLLADMIREMAFEISENRTIGDVIRESLLEGTRDLVEALRRKRSRKSG